MFVDEVTITLQGGKGGDGAMSFRREKFVPLGGPDGGNGGHGGSVILRAEHNRDTLSDFRMKKVFRAQDGVKGGSKNLHGKNAPPLILTVPVGTVVYDAKSKEMLCDLQQSGQEFEIARGGRGGFGNAHFTSSTRQAPKFAELGDTGEKKVVTLTLKLVADVGIIGFPNAGKSTLIARISKARPKIADYPFTTLIPHLGIVEHKRQSFVISDNPGLIEGAAGGKGLGIAFLKHIERTRVLLHLIDGFSGDPYKTYKLLQSELKKYDRRSKKQLFSSQPLAEKPQVVVVNKIDLLSEEEMQRIRLAFRKEKAIKLFFVSGASGKNLNELLDAVLAILAKFPVPQAVFETAPDKVFRPHLDNPRYFEVVKKRNVFTVRGERVEQIVRMTPPGNRQALERVYDVLKKTGIHQELLRQGAQDGHKIKIAQMEILFRE